MRLPARVLAMLLSCNLVQQAQAQDWAQDWAHHDPRNPHNVQRVIVNEQWHQAGIIFATVTVTAPDVYVTLTATETSLDTTEVVYDDRTSTLTLFQTVLEVVTDKVPITLTDTVLVTDTSTVIIMDTSFVGKLATFIEGTDIITQTITAPPVFATVIEEQIVLTATKLDLPEIHLMGPPAALQGKAVKFKEATCPIFKALCIASCLEKGYKPISTNICFRSNMELTWTYSCRCGEGDSIATNSKYNSAGVDDASQEFSLNIFIEAMEKAKATNTLAGILS